MNPVSDFFKMLTNSTFAAVFLFTLPWTCLCALVFGVGYYFISPIPEKLERMTAAVIELNQNYKRCADYKTVYNK